MEVWNKAFRERDTNLHVVDLVDEASGCELVQKEEVSRVAMHKSIKMKTRQSSQIAQNKKALGRFFLARNSRIEKEIEKLF